MLTGEGCLLGNLLLKQKPFIKKTTFLSAPFDAKITSFLTKLMRLMNLWIS